MSNQPCVLADSLFVNFFSDANCSTLIENVPALVDVCFTNDADDGGYITDDGAWGSYSTVCTLGDPTPLPGDSITLS